MTSSKESTMEHEQGRGRLGRALTDYHRLTPDVEPGWVEDFVLEQRLLGIPGERIGDALAVVQSHVAESGEGALGAFGDPTTYAREAAPRERIEDLDGSWFLGNGLGLAGMLITTTGFSAWLAGERVELTVGSLVMAALIGAVFLALHLASEPMLRFIMRRPLTSLILFMAHVGALITALSLFRAPVAELPAGWTMALGAACLGLGVVLEWRSTTGGDLDDPITGPGESAPAPGRSILARVTLLLFPLFTLALLGFTWVVHVLS